MSPFDYSYRPERKEPVFGKVLLGSLTVAAFFYAIGIVAYILQ